MKATQFFIVTTMAISLAFASCNGASDTNQADQHEHMEATAYHCPMKCEDDKTYDKAGKCPVCGMDLVEKEE